MRYHQTHNPFTKSARASWSLVAALVAVALVGGASSQRRPPNYSYDQLPDTSFTCRGRVVGGYYADVEAGCQMFHVCGSSQLTSFRFLCPNDTVFDQQHLICANWHQVLCDNAAVLYGRNYEIFKTGVDINSLDADDRLQTSVNNRQFSAENNEDGLPSSANSLNSLDTWPSAAVNWPSVRTASPPLKSTAARLTDGTSGGVGFTPSPTVLSQVELGEFTSSSSVAKPNFASQFRSSSSAGLSQNSGAVKQTSASAQQKNNVLQNSRGFSSSARETGSQNFAKRTTTTPSTVFIQSSVPRQSKSQAQQLIETPAESSVNPIAGHFFSTTMAPSASIDELNMKKVALRRQKFIRDRKLRNKSSGEFGTDKVLALTTFQPIVRGFSATVPTRFTTTSVPRRRQHGEFPIWQDSNVNNEQDSSVFFKVPPQSQNNAGAGDFSQSGVRKQTFSARFNQPSTSTPFIRSPSTNEALFALKSSNKITNTPNINGINNVPNFLRESDNNGHVNSAENALTRELNTFIDSRGVVQGTPNTKTKPRSKVSRRNRGSRKFDPRLPGGQLKHIQLKRIKPSTAKFQNLKKPKFDISQGKSSLMEISINSVPITSNITHRLKPLQSRPFLKSPFNVQSKHPQQALQNTQRAFESRKNAGGKQRHQQQEWQPILQPQSQSHQQEFFIQPGVKKKAQEIKPAPIRQQNRGQRPLEQHPTVPQQQNQLSVGQGQKIKPQRKTQQQQHQQAFQSQHLKKHEHQPAERQRASLPPQQHTKQKQSAQFTATALQQPTTQSKKQQAFLRQQQKEKFKQQQQIVERQQQQQRQQQQGEEFLRKQVVHKQQQQGEEFPRKQVVHKQQQQGEELLRKQVVHKQQQQGEEFLRKQVVHKQQQQGEEFLRKQVVHKQQQQGEELLRKQVVHKQQHQQQQVSPSSTKKHQQEVRPNEVAPNRETDFLQKQRQKEQLLLKQQERQLKQQQQRQQRQQQHARRVEQQQQQRQRLIQQQQKFQRDKQQQKPHKQKSNVKPIQAQNQHAIGHETSRVHDDTSHMQQPFRQHQVSTTQTEHVMLKQNNSREHLDASTTFQSALSAQEITNNLVSNVLSTLSTLRPPHLADIQPTNVRGETRSQNSVQQENAAITEGKTPDRGVEQEMITSTPSTAPSLPPSPLIIRKRIRILAKPSRKPDHTPVSKIPRRRVNSNKQTHQREKVRLQTRPRKAFPANFNSTSSNEVTSRLSNRVITQRKRPTKRPVFRRRGTRRPSRLQSSTVSSPQISAPRNVSRQSSRTVLHRHSNLATVHERITSQLVTTTQVPTFTPVSQQTAVTSTQSTTDSPPVQVSTLPTNKEAPELGRHSGFFVRPKLQLSSAVTSISRRRDKITSLVGLAKPSSSLNRAARSSTIAPYTTATRRNTAADATRLTQLNSDILSNILFANSSPGRRFHEATEPDYDYESYDTDILPEQLASLAENSESLGQWSFG